MTLAPSASTSAAPPVPTPAGGVAGVPTDDVAAVLIALQYLQSQTAAVNDRMAKELGVGATDFSALVHLSVRGATPPKKVGEALGLSSGAMTALADRLEVGGLVTRQQHPTDRRSFVLALTPAGVDGVNAVGALYGRAVQEALPASRRPLAEAVFRDLGAALESPAS